MWRSTASTYQEMHVDGGIMAQVFAYPVGISAEGGDSGIGGPPVSAPFT